MATKLTKDVTRESAALDAKGRPLVVTLTAGGEIVIKPKASRLASHMMSVSIAELYEKLLEEDAFEHYDESAKAADENSTESTEAAS